MEETKEMVLASQESHKVSFEFVREKLPTEIEIRAEVEKDEGILPEERDRVVSAILKTMGRIRLFSNVVTELKRGDNVLRLREIPLGQAKHQPDLKPLLVWTERRELAMGWTDAQIWDDQMILYDACMVVRYSASHFGVLGLCTQGPDGECRITPAAKRLFITKVEWAADVEPAAIPAWESRPWFR